MEGTHKGDAYSPLVGRPFSDAILHCPALISIGKLIWNDGEREKRKRERWWEGEARVPVPGPHGVQKMR